MPKQRYNDRPLQDLRQQSLISSLARPDRCIREKYGIDASAVTAINLRPLSRHAACDEYRSYFLDTGLREHYQLLACLSTRFQDAHLFDIGTLKGYSALALSYNPHNRVISYDIDDHKSVHHAEQLSNIEYRIGNALDAPELLSSALIFLDTEHDGSFEAEVYYQLKQNGYKGLLVLDDIYLNDAMKRFWHNIDLPREDVTDLGHWSGTGIVDFGA